MYQKKAFGEILSYRPASLKDYKGRNFCLRITLNSAPLEDCFFVYLPEVWETETVEGLFCFYFKSISVIKVQLLFLA
jgi:hypothetical protein